MANSPTLRKQQSKRAASDASRPTARLRPQNRKLLVDGSIPGLPHPIIVVRSRWNGFGHDLRSHRTTFRPIQTE